MADFVLLSYNICSITSSFYASKNTALHARPPARFSLIWTAESANITAIRGRGEMTKRILCRVVRSVPLADSSEARPGPNPAHNMSDKFMNATPTNVRSGLWRNWATYTGRGDVSAVSIESGPTGQILDCLV